MPIFHLILVALIQGITEFLPVSSSGHLILLPHLTGLQDQGVVIDVAAHIGTLAAVVLYFWKDVKLVFAGLPYVVTRQWDKPGASLALTMIIATVPVILVGLVLKVTGLSDAMRTVTVIGWTMIIFGLVLYIADRRGAQAGTIEDLTATSAWKLGLWQAIALIPGTSRSGIVITGALFAGFSRTEAARIAMLMSIPTIVASGVLTGLDLIGGEVPLRDTLIVIAFSCIAALFALSLMMRLLNTISFTPYVIYRVLLGIVLLWLSYSGALSI